MSDHVTRLRNRRAGLVVALSAALLAASALPLTVASCRTQQPRADEPAAYERLRMLTHGGTLPAESVVAQLAADFAGTRTGALAQLVRARARYEARDCRVRQLATVSGSAEAASSAAESATTRPARRFRSRVTWSLIVPRLMTRGARTVRNSRARSFGG